MTGGPLYRWSPPHRHTHSEIVCELAARLRFRGRSMIMDAAQRPILDDIFAEDDHNLPSCFEVAVVAPRQNIKSAVLQVAAIADLVLFDVELHIWTAHLAKTATSAFQAMRAMIKSDPDTQALFRWPPNAGKGQEYFETLDGRRIVFYSRSSGGGRGETSDKLTVDEALFAGASDIGAILPTLATIEAAQVRYASSGGLPASEFLRDVRDRGRAGGDSRLGYHEFGAPRTKCADEHCEHRDLNDPGCALNDRALWRQANVACPERISEERLLDFRKALPPDEFAREFLSWWEDPAADVRLIAAGPWAAAKVPAAAPASQLHGPVALGIEVSEDRKHSAVGLAGLRDDGRRQVELVAYAPGTAWVVEHVAGIVKRRRPCAVVLDPGGPAGPLKAPLEAAGVDVFTVTQGALAQACGGFVADVLEVGPEDVPEAERKPRLAHPDEFYLNAGAAVVQRRDLAQSWAFDRTNYRADIAPLMAVALARHGLVVNGSAASAYEDRGLLVL